MHKKALAFTWMHALIIMLLVLVVMLFFVSDISNLIKGTAEKDTCKASVYKNAVGNMKFVDIASDINCPTQNITIKGDDAKKRLAGAMYDCWDKFGEGKLNLFDRNDIYCIICSRIDFQQSAKVDGFPQYLNEQRIPGKEITYLEYLQDYQTPRSREVIGTVNQEVLNENSPIDTSRRYATIFVYARGDEFIKKLLTTSVTTVGFPIVIAGGIMVAAGAAMSHFGVGIPLLVSGGKLMVTGLGVATAGGIEAYFESTLRMEGPEHIAFVALREYNQEELDKLGCKYLPARQK